MIFRSVFFIIDILIGIVPVWLGNEGLDFPEKKQITATRELHLYKLSKTICKMHGTASSNLTCTIK